MYTWYWLAVLVILISVELCTLALTTIWFAGGALAALITSCFTDSLVIQCIAFGVISLVLLLFLRPSVVRRFNRKRAKTNVDTAAGKTVRVIEAVDNISDTGRVLLDGLDWTARSSEDEITFNEGETATVVRVEGVKLIIAKEG